jgi:predicted molibdopterin-dependent oxidoreductase YjgC
MFRRLNASDTDITIYLDGQPIQAAAGDSVAAALLAAGVTSFRTCAVTGEPRAPYCMIGNCYECLVEIDGWPDRQACLVPVAPGMRVRRRPAEEPTP